VTCSGGIIPPHGIEGRVTFDNVHFHYPSRPDAEVGIPIDHIAALYFARVSSVYF